MNASKNNSAGSVYFDKRALTHPAFGCGGNICLPSHRRRDGTQRAAFQITELIEHSQRMIAAAIVAPVPDAVLVFAVPWT